MALINVGEIVSGNIQYAHSASKGISMRKILPGRYCNYAWAPTIVFSQIKIS